MKNNVDSVWAIVLLQVILVVLKLSDTDRISWFLTLIPTEAFLLLPFVAVCLYVVGLIFSCIRQGLKYMRSKISR